MLCGNGLFDHRDHERREHAVKGPRIGTRVSSWTEVFGWPTAHAKEPSYHNIIRADGELHYYLEEKAI